MATIHACLWRVAEGKALPIHVQLGARCRQCGCSLEVLFQLSDMQNKPERVRCPLCGGHEMKLLHAKAQA